MRARMSVAGPAAAGASAGPLLLCGLVAGCTPDLGAPPSLIDQNRVLAIKGEPPEAAPGAEVRFTVLAASPGGTVAAPPLNWALCVTPKPLSESNSVPLDCVNGPSEKNKKPLDDVAAGVPTLVAHLSDEACKLFGNLTPDAPAGQPPLRARDPDITGGFYQPMRVTWVLGGPGGGDLVDFGFERIACGLANAPTEATMDFKARYQRNTNPALSGVGFARVRAFANDQVADREPAMPLVADGAGGGAMISRAQVPSPLRLEVTARWSDASAECFPVFDLARSVLVDHTEALRVSWFATAGRLLHDRTGVAAPEDCSPSAADPCSCPCRCRKDASGGAPATTCACAGTDPSSANVWTALDERGNPVPAGTAVHLWAVLRDSRGGVDFAGYQFTLSD